MCMKFVRGFKYSKESTIYLSYMYCLIALYMYTLLNSRTWATTRSSIYTKNWGSIIKDGEITIIDWRDKVM